MPSSRKCGQQTKSFQGSCGGCDYTYTAKSKKQDKMYKRLHEKKCSHSNPVKHSAKNVIYEELKVVYNGGRIYDSSTTYTEPHGAA